MAIPGKEAWNFPSRRSQGATKHLGEVISVFIHSVHILWGRSTGQVSAIGQKKLWPRDPGIHLSGIHIHAHPSQFLLATNTTHGIPVSISRVSAYKWIQAHYKIIRPLRPRWLPSRARTIPRLTSGAILVSHSARPPGVGQYTTWTEKTPKRSGYHFARRLRSGPFPLETPYLRTAEVYSTWLSAARIAAIYMWLYNHNSSHERSTLTDHRPKPEQRGGMNSPGPSRDLLRILPLGPTGITWVATDIRGCR